MKRPSPKVIEVKLSWGRQNRRVQVAPLIEVATVPTELTAAKRPSPYAIPVH